MSIAPTYTARENARLDLRRALEDLKLATDARGLYVMIKPTSASAADCRAKLEEHLRFFNGARFGGGAGELAYARNIALLTNAWIAAIKFEIEAEKMPAPPDPYYLDTKAAKP